MSEPGSHAAPSSAKDAAKDAAPPGRRRSWLPRLVL